LSRIQTFAILATKLGDILIEVQLIQFVEIEIYASVLILGEPRTTHGAVHYCIYLVLGRHGVWTVQQITLKRTFEGSKRASSETT